jgi:hypothetical protein
MEFSELLINKINKYRLSYDVFFTLFAITVSSLLIGFTFISQDTRIVFLLMSFSIFLICMGGYFVFNRAGLNIRLSKLEDYVILNRHDINVKTEHHKQMLSDITNLDNKHMKPNTELDKILKEWKKY